MVIFFAPTQTSSPAELVRWIEKKLSSGLPESVRFMLADIRERPIYTHLSQLVETLEPKLDMGKALQEMASASGANDPDDPGVKYRAAFVHLTQNSQKGQLKHAKWHAQDCLKIAREVNSMRKNSTF